MSDYLKYTTDPLRLDDTEITISINLEQLVKDKLENLPENLKNQTAKWQQYQDKDGKAGVEWEMPTTTVTITVEEHHNYGEPTWSWNNDFTASAVFTCTDDDGHTQTVPATVTDEVTTEPTCDKEGLRTYTAKVTFEDKEYTSSKTETIPAAGHTLTAVAKVPATCETAGTSAHWKCDVCGKLFSDAEGKTETTLEKLTIPATGHAYGEPVWKWNDDFTASATFTCANDTSHVETVNAAVTNEVTTEATCKADGVRTYTAKVTFEGKEYTDTKTETIAATGHAYGEPVWKWNDDFTASATFTCGNDDSHVETVNAAVTNEVTTEATCKVDGVRTYTAKVTFEGKEYTDTKTEVIPATDHDTGAGGCQGCHLHRGRLHRRRGLQGLRRDCREAGRGRFPATGPSTTRMASAADCGAEEPTTPVEPGKPGEPSQPTQPEKPTTPDTPATGDSSNMTALWVVLAVAGLGIIALVVLLVTKRKSKKD